MSELNSIALNLYHDGQFFVAQLKRQQGEAISYAKHIFGEEPSAAQLYDFVLHEIESMCFTAPTDVAQQAVKQCRKNFKRMQREVRKELKSGHYRRERRADEVMREAQEQGAKQKQQALSRQEKELQRKAQFALKQQKKKQKKKGH